MSLSLSLSPPPRDPSFLNLGIVAHVDAGKTSLTERLLYEAGVLDAPGSVDAGTTRTDSLALERRRGITVRASVTSFGLGDVVVNLIDTPGHPDFVAEVERSLAVLDATVLVVSAVEGVQPQTVVIWRALRRVGIPTAVFINKVDRSGADVDRVLAQVRVRLGQDVVMLTRAHGLGDRGVRVTDVALSEEAVVTVVAEHDDRVLARWVDGEAPRAEEVRHALRRGVRDGTLTPAVCGSALTGAGTDALRAVLADLLPRPGGTPGGALAATVFAVDRDGRGRRAWARVWAGELRTRGRLSFDGRRPERVTEVAVSLPEGLVVTGTAGAGQIAVLRGPAARVGDTVGRPPGRPAHRFAPAALQALVEPEDPGQRAALFAGLGELAEEDPLIDLRLDPVSGEAALSLHGEVQREVVAALLEERYGVRAVFAQPTVVCLERVVGEGRSVERIATGDNPYLAGVGLQVGPAPVGHGVRFSPGTERGRLPPAFVAATEEGVRDALRCGLSGWAVTDCVVTMTESGYYPRQSRPHQGFDKTMSSVAGDFRHLTPVVLLAALAQASTVVCQPVDLVDLEVPDAVLGPVTSLLGRLGGRPLTTAAVNGWSRLSAHLASRAVPDLRARLPDLTGGEGVLVARLDHHAPVRDQPPPTRRRNGPDPLDRTAWFRDVAR